MATEQSKPTQEQALREIRNEIDAIDRQIHTLLNQRALCAQRVAEVKAEYDQQEAVFYRPEREAQVLRKVMERNEGPLADTEVARLFREIMSVCLAHEQPLKVVYAGSQSDLAHLAAYKHFGHSIKACALLSLEQVFDAVVAREADYAVIPLDASRSTEAVRLLVLLERHDLRICGEVELNAQDDAPSMRYLVIGDQKIEPSGQDKSAFLLRVRDVSNAIEAVKIACSKSVIRFSEGQKTDEEGISLLYIDFEGHSEDPEVRSLVSDLQSKTLNLKFLGSFPKAVL